MIQEFIDRFQEIKPDLLKQFQSKEPDSYGDILVQTLHMMFQDGDYDKPDASRLTVIDDGDYQGTLLFIIGANGYQPSTYWSVYVNYGSCSGCDSYQAVACYDNPEESADEMLLMALHMIQSMKQI